MKIIVKAKVNAKKTGIERLTQSSQNLLNEENNLDVYKVAVHERAVDGQANRAIVRAVAEHFKVAPSLVTIISGLTAKTKTVEILL
ncbi:DUF167 domain-containing protein [Candidatus Nomurabacteria bacterium]|nr:DUF167 domain-containing protein [Candidatus Nomurabacteria bacterium]